MSFFKKAIKTMSSKGLKKLLREMDSYVAKDTLISTIAVIQMLEKLERIEYLLEQIEKNTRKNINMLTRRRRKPSEYNIFIGEKLREGKTFSEALEEWRKYKGENSSE